MALKTRFICIVAFCALFAAPLAHAQEGMNRPYIDDKLFHFGFQIGMNFTSFSVKDSEERVDINGKSDVLHARVSGVTPGFHVGFVSDLRLCRYLNLRFCPGLQFSSRTISYKATDSTTVIQSATLNNDGTPKWKNKVDILSLPVYLPLYLKWSAEREANYRPYVIAGGGVSFNVYHDHENPIMLNLMDYFCEVGFGVDLYFEWFKFCPEITYRIGFGNQLCPFAERQDNLSPGDAFYSNAISRLTSHCVCLTFNFE